MFRLARIALLCLALVACVAFLAYHEARREGVAELRKTGLQRIELGANSLEREIAKYAFLPGTLNLNSQVVALLAQPPGKPGRQESVNAYLEQLNQRTGTLATYVMDLRGVVRAASNWRRADSYVGERLAFRPYFQDALKSGSGQFFGIGNTIGEPGYYLASAIADAQGTHGVAVVKVSLAALEQSWAGAETPLFVTDEQGIVILSSVADWKFKATRAIDASVQSALDRSQHYNRRALIPLAWTEQAVLDRATRIVDIPAAETPSASLLSAYPVQGRFLEQTQPLKQAQWTLAVLSQTDQMESLARNRAAIGGFAAAFAIILVVAFNERQQRLRAQLAAKEALQNANAELERKVIERTADLSDANRRLAAEIVERVRAERTLLEAQDELVQAGKLAVIGQLSTGIAHELNQPLAALQTLSTNAGRFLERGDTATARANLDRISALAARMGGITAQLRSFAQKSTGKTQAVAIGKVVDDALAVLEARLRKAAVRLTRHPPEREVHALCDPNRLEQVLVNLFGNAIDAVAGTPEPSVDVTWHAAQGKIIVVVRDRGPGLSAEAQNHLFKAFFTTKAAHGGLGLGLTISADIVKNAGGQLHGANCAEGGAAFTIELPRAD